MAVGMSMLGSVFVRCRRSVLRNVLVLSLQNRAMVHKMSCVCLNAKIGRRRTVLSAMVVVVVQVRKSRFQAPGLPCRTGATFDLSAPRRCGSAVLSGSLLPPATMDVNFRKIDIDQYDEDVLFEHELYEPDPRDPAQVLSDTKQKATAIRGFLSKYAISTFCSQP